MTADATDGTDEMRIEPLQRSKTLSEVVADRLRAMILSGHLGPGERLPSERELADRFGVSRTVIREAVKRLAGSGLLEPQTGSGIVVATVRFEPVKESMNWFLRGRAFLRPEGLEDAVAMIHEVRTTLEARIAHVAAAVRTDTDLEQLAAAHEAMVVSKSVEDQAAADVAFHRCLAVATHNVLYVALLDSIQDPLTDIRIGTLRLPDRLPDAHAGHERILEAVRAQQADEAANAMRLHLAESAEALSRLKPEHLRMFT